jgi:hypothetical protein
MIVCVSVFKCTSKWGVMWINENLGSHNMLEIMSDPIFSVCVTEEKLYTIEQFVEKFSSLINHSADSEKKRRHKQSHTVP